MAKIQIKSERITPFGGIFPIMDFFNRILSQTIDKTLGLRSKFFGYQYSEIIRSLMCIFFCGGTCIEDVSKHLMPYLSQHPKLRTCSSDTILRAIEGIVLSSSVKRGRMANPNFGKVNTPTVASLPTIMNLPTAKWWNTTI